MNHGSHVLSMRGIVSDEIDTLRFHASNFRSRYSQDGKVELPDGEGGTSLLYQHKGDSCGVLITEDVDRIVTRDFNSFGGNVLANRAGVELIYTPRSKSLKSYVFVFSGKGAVCFFGRYDSDGIEDFSAVSHSVNYGTLTPYQPIHSSLHWLGFSIFRDYTTPELRVCDGKRCGV